MRFLLALLVVWWFCCRVRQTATLCLMASTQKTSDLPSSTLNSYFPFQQVSAPHDWPQRQAEIKRRILVSQGLWPLPSKSDLNAVIHGRVDRDDYYVDRVYFESAPGHFVTGSLYRPKGKTGPFPAILSPHGHWVRDGFTMPVSPRWRVN